MYGYVAVSIFFFLSGYGLIYGLNNKNKYLDGFMKKRLTKILIPYISINFLYIVFYIFIEKKNLNIFQIIMSFIDLSLNKIAWYIIIILFCYILFYIIFKSFKKKYALIIYSGIMFIYMILAYVLHLGIWWYISIPTIVLGVFWGEFKNIIDKFIIKYNKFILIMLLITFLIVFSMLYIFNINEGLIKAILVLVSELVGTMLVLSIMTRIKVKNKNGIFKHIGEVSLEFYLIHPLIIRLVHILTKNEIIAIPVIIICTYIIARLLNYFNNYLIKRVGVK